MLKELVHDVSLPTIQNVLAFTEGDTATLDTAVPFEGNQMTSEGDVKVKEPLFETSRSGVFAVGDCASPHKFFGYASTAGGLGLLLLGLLFSSRLVIKQVNFCRNVGSSCSYWTVYKKGVGYCILTE
jgi:hypothetical protein